MIRKMKALSLLLAAAFTLTSHQVVAQWDDGPHDDDGMGHWDWPDSPPPPNGCPATVINISTGIDASGSLLPAGAAEPTWICPSGMGTVVNAISAWDTLPGCKWLSGNGYTNFSYYSYVRNFSVPTGAIGTITFQALADNKVSIYLDGGASPVCTTGSTMYGFQIGNMVTYTAFIGPGGHNLTAVVYNEKDISGFTLAGTVSYTIPNSSIDISTGISGYLPLPIGVPDPNWSCSTPPYNIVSGLWSSMWGTFSGSQWISGNFPDIPAGHYTYDRTFTVPATGGLLSFEALADNHVDFYLDGSTWPFAQTIGSSGYLQANVVTYTGLVTPGAHTLHAVVTNNSLMLGLNLHGGILFCNPEHNNSACMVDPNFSIVHSGPGVVSFFSSTNPMNNSSLGVFVTHLWDFGDGTFGSAIDTFNYYAPGTYTVQHTVSKITSSPDGAYRVRCSRTKTCVITIDEDAQIFFTECDDSMPWSKSAPPAATDSKPLFVFPNPAHDELKFSSELDGASIEIMSMDGRSIRHLPAYSGNKIDISDLAGGTYMVRVIRGTQVNNFKFSKVD